MINMRMAKHYSWKFWIFFWSVSAVLLAGWFAFLEIRNGHWNFFRGAVNALPVSEERREDMKTLLSVADAVLKKDDVERTYLILFQNNYELRPGGGFIGSFGVLKIKNGDMTDFQVHDTGNFDGRIPSTVPPPYPMKETLRIDSWKFRDSNYSPDFSENAKQAIEFYKMGNGGERFDGVVGITANVLTSFLGVTGPVSVSGFPGTYGGDSAIWDLEYQVERGYIDQGIEKGERKSMMNLLGMSVLDKVRGLGVSEKYRLFETVLADLHQKDIQVMFTDDALMNAVRTAGWSGEVDQTWKNDFLLAVDANLGAWKSDYFVKRSYEYTLDMTGNVPHARFSVRYMHTAEAPDWRVKDYQSYLRLYVPKGSWLESSDGFATEPVFGETFGKKYFGAIVQVPVGTEKTVTFDYTIPSTIDPKLYELLIEKQAGIESIPVSITVLRKDEPAYRKEFVMSENTTLNPALE